MSRIPKAAHPNHTGFRWRARHIAYIVGVAVTKKLSGNVAAISFLGIISQSGVHFASGSGIGTSLSGLGNLGRGLGSLGSFLGSVVQIALLALAIAAFFYVLLFVVATITTIRLPLRWILLEPAKAAAGTRHPEWQAMALVSLAPLTAWDRTRHGLTIVLALCIPVWALLLIVRVLLEWNVLLMSDPQPKACSTRNSGGPWSAARDRRSSCSD